MRQVIAAVLLVTSVVGLMLFMGLGPVEEPQLDETAINKKIDTRLHEVLAGLLEKERQTNALRVTRR